MRLSENPRVDLFNEDCISGMHEKVGAGTIDLIVTSIPF